MFKPIDLAQLTTPAFTLFDKSWFLLTVGTREAYNAMTISWGALGTFCGLPAAHIMVRPNRHSFGFIEANEQFTLSRLPRPMFDPALKALGTLSGRDHPNKIAEAGLSMAFFDTDTPAIAEADLVLRCRVIYKQEMDPTALDPALNQKWFALPEGGTGFHHKLYVGQVSEALIPTHS